MVAHQRAMDLAALANVTLQEQGVAIGLEASPETPARAVAPRVG